MKKVLLILSVFIISFSVTFCVSAASDGEILYQLGIASQISENEEDDVVTRAEFVYSVSKLIDGAEYEPCETAFEDVDADNEYSGYINFLYHVGAIKGYDGRFEPEAGITPGDAYYIILKYMGYDVFQKNYSNYTDFAVSEALRLRLNKNVTVSDDGYLTQKGLRSLLVNALTAQYFDMVNYQSDTSKISILSDRLNINVYRATVESVSDSANAATLKITDSYSQANIDPIRNGTVRTFSVSGKVNISEYEYAPIIVYIYDNEKIVAAALQQNAEICYRAIYAVNGDEEKSSKYLPSAITSIATYENKKKYKIGEGFTVKYNDNFVTEPVALAGKYAKIILSDNKIIRLETWELEYGGIVQNVSSKKINYIRGSSANAKLEFEDCEKIRVYIDGELSNLNHLKRNTYFDYRYKENDFLVIVASEKVISDKLSAVSDSGLFIGDDEYQKGEILFVSKINGIYSQSNDVKDMIGNKVEAFFNCRDEVTYVRIAADSFETAYVSDFIGIVKDYDKRADDFLDGRIDEVSVDIYMLDGDAAAHTFVFTDKTIWGDETNSLTLSEVLKNRKKTDGSGIYLFKVTNTGKIKSVKKPVPYQLANGQTTPTKGLKGSFASDSNQSVTINGKTVMFGSEDIVLLYEKDDEFTVSKVKASDLQAKNVSPAVTLEFFGYEDSIDIRLIAAYGEGLGDLYNYAQNFGIIEYKRHVIDKDEDIVKCEYDLISKAGSSLTLSTEKAAELPKKAFVRFNTLVNKGINSVIIQDGYTVDLSEPTEEWGRSGILKYAGIDRINSKAVRFDDGEVYFFNTKYLSVFEYKDREFRLIDIEDVQDNDNIYYHMSTYDGMEAICAVIVVR